MVPLKSRMRRSDGLRSKKDAGGFGAGWKTSLRWQRMKKEGGLNPCSEVGADSQEVQSGRGSTQPVRPPPAWLSHSLILFTQQNGDVILPW